MDQLYFVVHTHWDREWYQPFQQMRARLVTMADRMIPLVERGTIPSFHFDGQTIVLDDYLEMRPRAEPRLRNLIRAGKIQVGPWYVLADSFLVSGESLIRNLEIGMAIARRFGRPLDVGYLPDQFGHIAQMPQILAGFGFTTAVLWRGVGADVNRNRFTWEALDGSSVLTVYLPNGYSNGANLPLETVDSFVARAEQIASRERDFAAGTPILVMNGTDHAEPDARLSARINEAREISAMTFETGSLENYVRRLAELPLDGTPRHRGELRSPLRSHLLPGVTSARTWIKQRDFENCRALERYADPLAALANALGRGAGLDAFLEMAWRTEIQNHPHDSICGCSVDQVHIDMRYRFDQAAMLTETAVRRAAAACLNTRNVDASEIAVFNPSLARSALVSGEAEVADPAAHYAVETADGRRIPVATRRCPRQRALDSDMPAAEFKSIIGGLSQPSVFGRTVNRFEIATAADGRPQVNLFMSRAAFSDLDLEEFQARDSHPHSRFGHGAHPCDQRRAMHRQFRRRRSRANGIQLLSARSRRFRRGPGESRSGRVDRERIFPPDADAARPGDSRSHAQRRDGVVFRRRRRSRRRVQLRSRRRRRIDRESRVDFRERRRQRPRAQAHQARR